MTFEESIAKRLIARKKTLAVAESCTGGLLCHRLTNIPGSSQFLKVGLITYSNDAKTKLLRVPSGVLKKYGAVSAPTARLMAQNARKILKTDYAVAITGIAGPSGATKNKPVGLTFIAASTPNKFFVRNFVFKGPRISIKRQATTQALKLILGIL